MASAKPVVGGLPQWGVVGLEHVAALSIVDLGIFVNGIADSIHHSHISGGLAEVVTQEDLFIIGVGSDDGNGLDLILIEGKQPVILEQHDGLSGHF